VFVDQHCDATVKSTLPETLREKRDRAIAVEHFETDEHFELSHLRQWGSDRSVRAYSFYIPGRRVAKLAGVQPLRIHDLRHFAASTLTGAGVEDNIIGLLTGHKSRELRRYPWNRISPLPAMVEML
jgi:integrase